MIDKKTVEEIREKAEIVKVVSDYLALRKRGKNYLALCPFHSEKTPSFTVSEEKQLFHCFGCGEGGNSISFIMKIENLSFGQALKHLADKFNIAADIKDVSMQQPDQNAILYKIIIEAADFYQEQLMKSKEAVAYAQKRGFDKTALSSFRIGYSLPEWDSLYRHLLSKGYLPKDIENAGLTIQKEGSSSYYDRFRNRLMFPIADTKGRTVGFGARSIDKSEPKYLNSPDSAIYNKSNVVYGLNLAKDAIKEKDCVMIMEGYMDVVTSHSYGFNNSIASSGTALTVNQSKLLSRFTNNFILVFDSDNAGSLATVRSIDMLMEIGIYPKIVTLSGGKDPDEILKKEGKDAFAALIASAVPWIRYKIEKAIAKYNINEPEGKAKAFKEAAAVLGKEKDTIVLNEYIRFISEKLKIDIDLAATEVKRNSYFGRRPNTRQEEIKKPLSKIKKAEWTLIRLLIESDRMKEKITESIDPGYFLDEQERKIFTVLSSDLITKDMPASGYVDMLDDNELKKTLSEILIEEHEVIDDEKTFADCINVLKSDRIKRHIEKLRHDIIEAEKAQDLERLDRLQKEYKQSHDEMRVFM